MSHSKLAKKHSILSNQIGLHCSHSHAKCFQRVSIAMNKLNVSQLKFSCFAMTEVIWKIFTSQVRYHWSI